MNCSLQTSREQLAVAAFANSLLVIPKVLTVNSAFDATDLVAKLRAFHVKAQSARELQHLKWSVGREEGEFTGFFKCIN